MYVAKMAVADELCLMWFPPDLGVSGFGFESLTSVLDGDSDDFWWSGVLGEAVLYLRLNQVPFLVASRVLH